MIEVIYRAAGEQSKMYVYPTSEDIMQFSLRAGNIYGADLGQLFYILKTFNYLVVSIKDSKTQIDFDNAVL